MSRDLPQSPHTDASLCVISCTLSRPPHSDGLFNGRKKKAFFFFLSVAMEVDKEAAGSLYRKKIKKGRSAFSKRSTPSHTDDFVEGGRKRIFAALAFKEKKPTLHRQFQKSASSVIKE